MEHMKFETPDMVSENIDKIAALFPSAITEMRGEDGEIKRGVNFEVLKQLLSRDVVDGDECYEFTWVGKKAAMAEAARPITKTLRPVKADSRDWDTTENLYIEGDNLEVLKILQESYLGKVKMIYIDPPYNTGSDKFTYPDNYRQTYSEYEEDAGILDEDENYLFKENTQNEPHFHSIWCSTMYSRLLLARNLLKEDGCIFVSIDDNEQENMKKMCDEVFGAANYLASFKWNRTAKAPSLSDSIRIKYEYVLAYTRGTRVKLFGKKSYNTEAPLLNIANKPSELIFPAGSILVSENFPIGEYSTKYCVELLTPIYAENGLNCTDVKISARFKWTQGTVNEYLASNRKFLIKKSPATIYYQLSEENAFIPPADIINEEECGVKKNTDASADLLEMGIPFQYSKPVSLIKYLIKSLTYNADSDIILDFFSGSATTAHAVMQLNSEDGGHRKFIMVQLPEKCDEASEAYKAGYKNICEIGKERIRRAGDKIKSEHPDAKLDTGFRVFRVDESNMEDVYYHPEELTQTMLGGMVSNIKPDRTDLDLLYACLLDWGVEISLSHTQEVIDGCTVHNVDNGALCACFDERVPLSVIDYMAKQQPLRAVFRDSSFAADDSKINVTEIFKNLSPDTKVKVI